MCFQFDSSPSHLKHEGCHRPNCQYSFYDVSKICKEYSRLPFCIRILLECAVRKSLTSKDEKVTEVWKSTVDQILQQCCGPEKLTENAVSVRSEKSDAPSNPEWYSQDETESIMFHPGRVVLQDFTGVAALVDLAALRDSVHTKVNDLSKVDCQCPADLVVDNFAQVDFSQISQAASSAKAHHKNCSLKNISSDEKSLTLGVKNTVSDGQNNMDTKELSQGMQNMAINESSHLTPSTTFPPPPCTHPSPPPIPIIHSTFPPPQGASYLPLDQSLQAPNQESLQEWLHPCYQNSFQQQQQQINGNLLPYSILQTPPPMQQNIDLATGYYIQPNVSYTYNGTHATSIPSFQAPSFIPTPPSPGANAYPQVMQMSVPPYNPPPHSTANESSYNKPKSQESSGQQNSNEELGPPDDNPGLPLQEEVCPFHQHMSYWADQLRKNRKTEMAKNEERFCFLKWVDGAFSNITVIPPGTGMWHQLNLEYLARIVTSQDGLLFPDSLVGTDTHTTMVNGLGVLGWTVGTLDAEAVMFGHPLSLPEIPKVVGVYLHGKLKQYATSTDLVLLITKQLRKCGDDTKDEDRNKMGNNEKDTSKSKTIFVEFFGPSVNQLSIADRSAVANLCTEYGAKVGYFPVDDITIDYLRHTGRDNHQVEVIEMYMKRVGMFRSSKDDSQENHETSKVGIKYDSVVNIDLSDAQVTISGPKKAKERVLLEHVSENFYQSLTKLYDVPSNRLGASINIDLDGKLYSLRHGTILSAAIASSTNTSNPSVILTAGLLAKKAVEAGLEVPKFIKTSLAPGPGIVTSYLRESGVMPYLYMLGFEVIGYGCTTCVANANARSIPAVLDSISQNGLVCCGVFAGNRNFEGRLDRNLRANYLTSAPLVIAYALAGRVDIDFEKEPLSTNGEKPVFLSDIWPSRKEVQDIELNLVVPAIFNKLKRKLSFGNPEWNSLQVNLDENLFCWNPQSTYIKPPRHIEDLISSNKLSSFNEMRILAKYGDSVSSDHISPAGSIVRNSPAADYLSSKGLVPRQFNSYGSRRGNWEVMQAGTFSHLKLKNEMANKSGPFTVHQPSGVQTTIVEASSRYRDDIEKGKCGGLVIIGGVNFGRGAPRDWATKGPLSLGVRVVMAVSFDENYLSNLVQSGMLPLQITRKVWEQLKGDELLKFVIEDRDGEELKPSDMIIVEMLKKDKEGTEETIKLQAKLRLDNSYQIKLFRCGGVIRDMLRKLNINE